MNDNFFEEILCKKLKHIEKAKYVIYGTKDIAMIYYNFIVKKFGEDSIAFFIDGKKDTEIFKGKRVYRCDELDKTTLNDYKYLIGSITKTPLFVENLKKLGVRQENILETVNYFSPFHVTSQMMNIKEICVYPEITTNEDLEQIIQNLSHYLIVDTESSKKVLLYTKFTAESELPCGYKLTTEIPKCKDKDKILLVWDVKHILDKEIEELHNVYCCDEKVLFYLNASMLSAISSKFYSDNTEEYYRKLSKENYQRLLKKCNQFNSSIICGTGSSLIESFEIYKDKFESSVIIVCNGFFEIQEVATKMSPHIYVLFDHNFLTSDYKKYLDNIIKYILKNDMFLFVNLRWVPLFQKKYQELTDRIIGLEPETNFNVFTTSERLVYLAIENVITSMCLPIASGLCDEIYITGCDGVKNNSMTHAHAEWNDNDDFNKNIINFNYGNSLINYFDMVNTHYKKIFEYGEKLNKSYKTLAHSNIYELEKRYLDNN